MDAVTALLTEQSLPTIIISLILILVAVKFISELISWFYGKAKTHFGYQTEKEKHEQTQDEKLENHFHESKQDFEKIGKRFDGLDEQILITHKNQERINKRLEFIEERQQENTRSFLIDAHHKFCYEIGSIDDFNLQSIERRYMYYKTAGGNSFIDSLVAEIRELPRAHLTDKSYDLPKQLVIEPPGKDMS